jgi:2-amino-4-hydroxy-6-hydroxymethyldihydropteridine diphosphokinase
MLDAAVGSRTKTSKILDNKAIGFDGPDFLNCVARYRTRRRPYTILRICKEIEYKMGRRETPEFAPDGSRIFHNRIIDIDILLYCLAVAPERSISIKSSELTIPHPQVESRSFVKSLLKEVL